MLKKFVLPLTLTIWLSFSSVNGYLCPQPRDTSFNGHQSFNEGQKSGRAHLTKSSPTKVSTALNKVFSQTSLKNVKSRHGRFKTFLSLQESDNSNLEMKEDTSSDSTSISSTIGFTNKLSPFPSSSLALPFLLTSSLLVLYPSIAGAVEEASPVSWISPTRSFVGLFLNVSSLAFLCRIVLSWYPQVNLNKFPTNVLAWPTEPFLKATRTVVPPAFGVDVSPIIWVAFLSFLNEILVSNQGILTILESK